VTLRGVGLVVSGISLAIAGWVLAWPELTVLGVACLIPVVVALLFATGGSRVEVLSDVSDFRVVRGEAANLRVSLRPLGIRRRLLRLVEGSPAAPRRSFAVRLTAAGATVPVPVDTSRRGLHPVGPFTVVRGDPWSVVRRDVGASPSGTVLVRPRTHPVRPGFAAVHRQGDSEAMTRRSGDDHFFALRDYILGDEPRNVHWRSSARSGRLVVKQKVSAAVDGIFVVLDTDAGAYPSTEAFAEAFLEERFEAAVEVAASLFRQWLTDSARVLLTTTRDLGGRIPQDRPWNAVADELALVVPADPLTCLPAALPSTARATGCSRLVVVTGAPNIELLASVRRCGSLSPVVVRVGGIPTGTVVGATVMDVSGPEALQ
jgi:uncharacterized protein (DUF58 family)